MEAKLQLLLVSCAAFGITTCQVEDQNGWCGLKGLKETFSYLLMGALLVICWLGVSNQEFGEGYMLSWVVATIVYVSQMIANLAILLESKLEKQNHVRFLATLTDIEKLLKLRLKQDAQQQELLLKLKWQCTRLAILSVVGLLVFATLELIADNVGYFWHGIVSILTMRLRIVQLLVYAEVLQNSLAALNRKLQQVVHVKTEKCSTHMLDVDREKLGALTTLIAIKQTYACIFQAFYLLNGFSGWSLLSIVCCYFLDFTCHAYWTLLALDNRLSPLTYATALATLLPLGVIICKFCVACHQLKKQSHLTSCLSRKLLHLRPLNSSSTKHYKAFAFDFALQLEHQKIQFTAKQFFNIDLSLIMKICVAILTHLVILIQFWKSEGTNL